MRQPLRRISLVLSAILLSVCFAEAQQIGKLARVGWFTGGFLSNNTVRMQAFREGLRELGYVEGKNISIEWRGAENVPERRRALAAELVRLKMDVIVTAGSPVELKEATTTIPIVMASADDPVGSGFIASLARPGGNITGLSQLSPELSRKRLEILKEVLPKLSRLAVFGTSTGAGQAHVMHEIEGAVAEFRMKLRYYDVLTVRDIETAFRSAKKDGADGVLDIIAGNIRSSARKELSEFAIKYQLPVMRERPEHVEAGGLISYGVNLRTWTVGAHATLIKY